MRFTCIWLTNTFLVGRYWDFKVAVTTRNLKLPTHSVYPCKCNKNLSFKHVMPENKLNGETGNRQLADVNSVSSV